MVTHLGKRDMENKREFTAPLEGIQDHDLASVGPKALSLARMSRNGLPVPQGFCVVAAAYREHIRASGLAAEIEDSVLSLENIRGERRREILSGIRNAIVQGTLSETATLEIASQYRLLSAGAVAVRSSATAEDLPGQSFAGQYDTFLNVVSLSKCLESVKRCWASLWTDRASEYRAKSGIKHLDVNMAVIVQEFVPAAASGVLFTADPVTGRTDRLVIECSFGLGEAIVSGKVTPDRFVLSKKLRVLERAISNKSLEIVSDTDGGVREQSLPYERSQQPCIGDGTARRLGTLALKVEKLFKCPQDIEWAVSDGEIFLLQSRPITSLPPHDTKSWEDRQVWTNANAGEVAPDVTTPVTWSLVQRMVGCLFEPLLDLVGIEFGDNPLFGLVAGRIYFNVNTVVGAIRGLPGFPNPRINRLFGGEQGKMFDLGQLELSDEDIPRLRQSVLRIFLRAPVAAFRFLSHSPEKSASLIEAVGRKARRLRLLRLASMSEDELVRRLTRALDDILNLVQGFLPVMRGLIALPILDRVCRKWLEDTDGTFANRLLAGTGIIESARAGHDLWRLAEKAHEMEAVQKTIRKGHDWQTTRERLLAVPGGDEFLSDWDAFMVRHGHHTRGEIELFNARWSESPDYILGLVRSYLGCLGRSDPLEVYQQRGREAERLAEQCRRRLRGPIKRVIFNHLLSAARQGAAFRENGKSQVMRYWTELRRMILELGQKLHARGLIGSPEDVFFLRLDEIGPVRRGEAAFDMKRMVAARREEFERNSTITPPKVVVGRFDTENFVPDAVDTETTVLSGIAVSAGVVTGKARVILKADMGEHLQAGEILVAPFTDPGWTPYFVPAAAIVMDLGGVLSHGSILAREYGIPAVVNVGPATKIVKTGQMIEVDANRGTVNILR